MTSRTSVPDAWDDDDWETRADQEQPEKPKVEVEKLTKAERRAKQYALNKKLWDEAEAPDAPYFVERPDIVPLQSELKPSVKLLSRRPTPKVIAKKDPVSGIEKLSIEDDDDEEADLSKNKPLTIEERQAKAKKEREDKQRKYEEVRERLFGSSSNPPSGTSSPRSMTPPRNGRGKALGSKEGRSTPSSGGVAKGKQLYDPSYTPKPSLAASQKQEDRDEKVSRVEGNSVVRQPRGPDNSGRGGFGFTSRYGSS